MNLELLCPNCHKSLDMNLLKCENKHQYFYDENVLILLNIEFGKYLNAYLKEFTVLRDIEKTVYAEKSEYNLLPFPSASNHFIWRQRQEDLRIIQAILKNRSKSMVLEIGSWNGWLTRWITKWGHETLTIDYFLDEVDGLKAKNYHNCSWSSIQMDIEDVSIILNKFDVIILNRCIHFFSNPMKQIRILKSMLTSKGILIITGLEFFRNSYLKRKEIEKFFKKRFSEHFNVYVRPTKAHFDFDDKKSLLEEKIQLKRYAFSLKKDIRTFLIPFYPERYYGIFQNEIL